MKDVAVRIRYDFVNGFQKIMSCTINRVNVRVLLDRINNHSNTGGNIYEVQKIIVKFCADNLSVIWDAFGMFNTRQGDHCNN